MRYFTIVALMLWMAGLMCAEAKKPTAASADEALLQCFKTFLDADHELAPSTASRLGDRRFDDRLENVSPEWQTQVKALYEQTRTQLQKQIAYDQLSRNAQIDYEIFKHHLDRSLWLMENTKPYANDPRTYLGYVTEGTYVLLSQSSAPRATNVRNCVSRMVYMPRILANGKKALGVCPKIYVETAIRQTQGAINYYQHDIYQLAGETPGVSELTSAATPVIAALKDYLDFLKKELLPKATEEGWRLGKDKFARKLELELEAGVTAEEVLKDAEAEADRVEHEMYVIARQLWYQIAPGKPLPPDDQQGRRMTIRTVINHLAQDHGKAENLVNDIKQTVEEIKKFIQEKDILRLPEPDQCQIIEMPEFQRGYSVAYLNNAPPLDTKVSSYYAISPPPQDWDAQRKKSYLEEYNRSMLKILSIHEGYPGHYVQLEYSNRCPSLIRRVLFSGVFAEGWAVYTEQTMLDQGFGQGDLSLRLHQLKFYLRAVVNALIDYKMHCENMTDTQVMDVLVNRAFQSEGEAAGKVIRGKLQSCQLSTYFVGRMAFYRLRQQVEREMGDAFDLGRYHEAVLAHGTLPVKYLPELVRERLKQPR